MKENLHIFLEKKKTKKQNKDWHCHLITTVTYYPYYAQTEMLFCSTVVGLPFLIPPMILTGELFKAWNACSQVPENNPKKFHLFSLAPHVLCFSNFLFVWFIFGVVNAASVRVWRVGLWSHGNVYRPSLCSLPNCPLWSCNHSHGMAHSSLSCIDHSLIYMQIINVVPIWISYQCDSWLSKDAPLISWAFSAKVAFSAFFYLLQFSHYEYQNIFGLEFEWTISTIRVKHRKVYSLGVS